NRKAVAISRLHFDVQTERYKLDKPVLDFLLTRRSAPIAELAEPGPSAAEIETILRVATRVPGHGQRTPWRFMLYRGESRGRVVVGRGGSRVGVGRLVADRAEERGGPLSAARREQALTGFARAPLVIGVVAAPKESSKIPQWEMFRSGGMVALKLVAAANAVG